MNGNKVNSLVLGLCATFVLASCNQQEFYEKEILNGAAVEKPSVNLPTDNGNIDVPETNGSTGDNGTIDNGGTNGDGSSNGDGGTNGDGSTNGSGGTNGDGSSNGDGGSNGDGSSNGDGGTNGDGSTNGNGGTNGDGGSIGDSGSNGGNGSIGDNGSNGDDGGSNGGTDGGSETDPDEGEENPTTPTVEYKTLTDRFVQNVEEQNKVDILWVIDDSGSMADEQASLGRNFNSFISDFIQKDVDFQMGITTTDATSRQNGKWVCNDKLLDSQSAKKDETKFLRDFERCVNVGIKGSGYEKGLHTSESFFKKYELPSNKKFLRDDAYLVIVYLSDEEDQSSKSVDEYLSFYRSLKKDEGKVKIYSIVTKEKNRSNESLGLRYIEASEKTGGMSADIEDDFYTILGDMGGKIVDLLSKFALARIPATQDIKVKVNGELVTSGYELDAQSGAVSFLEGYVPAPGSNIEIEYKVLKDN